MMTPEQLQVLIDKYLAQTETEAELQQLEELLRTDEQVRRQFAERISFDAVLAQGLKQQLNEIAEPSVIGGQYPDPSRRRFAWKLVAATVLGALAPSLVAASYARETGRLQEKNALLDADKLRLQNALDVIQKLIGAFTLTGDAPDGSTVGPGAVLSGTNMVTVAGYLDPQIIQRVEVVWDADGPDKRAEQAWPPGGNSGGPAIGAGFVPFSLQSAVATHPGRVVSVIVKAEPIKSAANVLERLQPGLARLERQAWFLGSEYGLVVKPAQDWIVTNLLPGARLDDDLFPLEGNAFVNGQLVCCHVGSDGTTYLLAPPVPLTRDAQLPAVQLDLGHVPNGNGRIRLLQLTTENAARLQDVPLDRPVSDLPPAVKQLEIPVTVQLPSVALRAARYVVNAGGSLIVFDNDDPIRNVDKLDPAAQVQIVDLSYCPSVRTLKRLWGLRQLQGLHLPGTHVNDQALQGLADHYPEMRWLELSDTPITDQAVVTDITRCSHLIMLGLSSNKQITNRSVEAIAERLPELEYLSLRDTSVTSILPLQRLQKLNQLYVSGNAIPQAELDELKRLKPGLLLKP